jgi:PAS domain S-box-containing protein
MPDQKKTKQQLIDELAECRQRVAELEAADIGPGREEGGPQVSAQWLQSLLSSLNDVVWAASADGSEFLYINEAAERVYGRPTSEFFENPDIWAEVVHPDDAERVWRESQDLLEQGSTESEYRIVRPDGEVRWLHDRKMVMLDDDGNPVRIGGIASDITQRKQTEGRMKFLADVLSSSPLSVVAADEGGKIIYVNPATEGLFGYTSDELLGKSPSILNADPDADKIQRDIFDRIGQGGVWRGKILNKKKSGEVFPIYASVYQLLDEEGSFMAGVGFQEDITEREQAEEELRKYREHLEDLVEERTSELQQEIVERKRAEEKLRHTVDDLERFNRLAVGRELRMIELKREVNELSQGLGREPPYDISFAEAGPTEGTQ